MIVTDTSEKQGSFHNTRANVEQNRNAQRFIDFKAYSVKNVTFINNVLFIIFGLIYFAN